VLLAETYENINKNLSQPNTGLYQVKLQL